ncbi:hypothetical protein AJ79_07686 [Helicocarpus griseus UAMH5409]|uniref:BZIP domain-containing protein n=1 Tax=Helicocarpus griseus UAMH5409 TaxID=1447875 RepID=A0A2B7X096_9EURO|nr:hypothetical protein AJ79_07686 [Helicocarpus griseus UAMH5409]
MSDFDSLYQRSLYLSPEQQDLLLAALSSADKSTKVSKNNFRGSPRVNYNMTDSLPKSTSPQVINETDTSPHGFLESPSEQALGPNQLDFDGSPFLDFDFDVDFDANGAGEMIGDLAGTSSAGDEGETGEKRKSIDGKDDEEESGKRRRETDDKTAKKPGRKPLTSEPTTKRKAQNRAAQRAFRERKEKHLKDLETKVEELEKASKSTSNENKLLRAQVERLQVELKEYRKRLSWANTGNSVSSMTGLGLRGSESRNNPRYSGNDFSFEFPKFGDLPGVHMFNNSAKASTNQPRTSEQPKSNGALYRTSNIGNGNSFKGTAAGTQPSQYGLGKTSPAAPTPSSITSNDTVGSNGRNNNSDTIDSPTAYYDNPVGLPSRNNTGLSYSGSGSGSISNYGSVHTGQQQTYQARHYGSSNVSNSNSPSASSESQPCHISSNGTSPEPSLNSPPTGKLNEPGLNTTNGQKSGDGIEGEKTFYEKLGRACGCAENPVPAALSDSNPSLQLPGRNHNSLAGDGILGFDWLAQQNGGQFDPVLFGDYRDPQDAVLAQDFGTFFNDAFPLPDLGSPLQSLNDLNNNTAPKNDLMKQIDNNLEADDEEVVPGEDRSQMLSCTKIWDRLQSMEKFRNGELDMDNLCSELRNKARCSEGGVVVKEEDVEAIMKRSK